MFVRLFISCSLLVTVSFGSPLHQPSSPELLERAKHYASLHPNTETQKVECQENMGEDDEINPLNAVINPRLRWPDNTVLYSIQNGVFTIDQVDRIETAIEDIMESTKVDGEFCVKFAPRETQPDYVFVQNGTGCSSYVGRIGGMQALTLQHSTSGSCLYHATIVHEFMHALGFHHEQTRPDRDDFVDIIWENIQPGTLHNFNKYDESYVTTYGTPYDYGSVLHYGPYAFAIDTTSPTIIPHDPDAIIGAAPTMSKWDIECIQIHYGCLDPEDSVYFKHLDKSALFKPVH